MAKRVLILLVCTALLLGGCAGGPEGQIFRYDIPGPVQNLDPQFTTDLTARMIVGNLYEGLLLASPEGEALPGVAESYSVSADRRTYTFALREDATWQDKDKSPVTAEDFVFAFQRMFRDDSPHAVKFASIAGATEILYDGADASRLAVRAEDAHTLVITLAQEDPFFPQSLCDPAAAPCNRAVFEESRGRYGLELQWVCGNGPFRLDRWDNTRYLLLRANEPYSSALPTLAGGVNFYIGRDSTKQFQDGKTDLAVLDWAQQDQLATDHATLKPVQKTVWCIVFNQEHRIWGNPLVRQGLAHTVDHPRLGEQAPASFVPSDLLVPGAVQVGGRSYRELAPAQSPLAFDTEQGGRLFAMGLAALELDQLPSNTTILIPDFANNHLNMSLLQQTWQKYLSAYLSFEVQSAAQIETRLRSGDYQMLLMPMTPADAPVSTLLSAFTSHSEQNYFGYHNLVYDELLEAAAAQPTTEAAAAKYAQAEATLLADAVVIPLYFETTYFAVAKGVQGIEISPFGDRISFKYALKE